MYTVDIQGGYFVVILIKGNKNKIVKKFSDYNKAQEWANKRNNKV